MKTLKPQLMTAMVDPRFHVLNEEEDALVMRSAHDTAPSYVPVLVIPLTAESVDDLIDRASRTAIKRIVTVADWEESLTAALATIGIKAPKPRRKGKS